MIVVRHSYSGACHLLSRICRAGIINAGDGMHEHPTQALLDAFTIREHKERIAGLEGGDRRRSPSQPCAAVQCPSAHEAWRGGVGQRPADTDAAWNRAGRRTQRRRRSTKPSKAQTSCMLLRVQLERMEGSFFPSLREYFSVFGMTRERLRRAKEDVIIMHPWSDEPWRRNRFRCGRWAVLGDSRTGRERGRGQDGGFVSTGRWSGR